MPVLTPGSMNSGLTRKYFSQTSRTVESSGGTTDDTMMPFTSAASTCCMENRLWKSTPYSSTVWVRMVATRQWARSDILSSPDLKPAGRWYTPSTVLVLPTSITSSIGSLTHWLTELPGLINRAHPAGEHCTQAFASAYAQKAALIEPFGHTFVAALFFHVNPPAARHRRVFHKARDDARRLQVAILAVERF